MAKTKPIHLAIGAFMYTLLFAGAGSGIIDRDKDNKCGGVERWKIKVATDDDATEIHTKPQTRTVMWMNSVNTDMYEIKRTTPRQDIEKQVYLLKNCFITEAILESDNDIHLVIEDGNKHTMVAEIPDPDCSEVKNSEFYEGILEARELFIKYQNYYKNYRWDLKGVLFIDKEHPISPTGNADNNVELHPVFGLKKVGKKFEF